MAKYLPLKIVFVDGRSMLVSSIADARTALQGQWRNTQAREYTRAERLIAAAFDGTCKPDAAFEAFKQAAIQQRLLVHTEPSPGLRLLDALAK